MRIFKFIALLTLGLIAPTEQTGSLKIVKLDMESVVIYGVMDVSGEEVKAELTQKSYTHVRGIFARVPVFNSRTRGVLGMANILTMDLPSADAQEKEWSLFFDTIIYILGRYSLQKAIIPALHFPRRLHASVTRQFATNGLSLQIDGTIDDWNAQLADPTYLLRQAVQESKSLLVRFRNPNTTLTNHLNELLSRMTDIDYAIDPNKNTDIKYIPISTTDVSETRSSLPRSQSPSSLRLQTRNVMGALHSGPDHLDDDDELALSQAMKFVPKTTRGTEVNSPAGVDPLIWDALSRVAGSRGTTTKDLLEQIGLGN